MSSDVDIGLDEGEPGRRYHPRRNRKGGRVLIQTPSRPTQLASWRDQQQIATVVPDGPMPESLHGVPFQSWQDAPETEEIWKALAGKQVFEEPPFELPDGKRPASGAVIVEPDQRLWIVSPTNRYWGYVNTFPKGTSSSADTLSLRANALKEVFEESGLRVELTGFLTDSDRTKSFTRYYMARRVGGNPADMGWESQAVSLVPKSHWESSLNQAVDRAIVLHLRAETP